MGQNGRFRADGARLETSQDGASGEVSASDTQAPRYSRTNVQHRGIAEPDLLKLTGSEAYVAPGQRRFVRLPGPEREADRVGQTARTPNTTVLDTTDPLAPERVGSVNASGRLFQANGTLIALEGTRLVAHDVRDPTATEQRWEHTLEGSIESARRIGDRVLLVVETPADRADPCPIEPMSDLEVACTDIYRPDDDSVETTYTAIELDVRDGTVEDRVSIAGTARNTVTYVSNRSIYVSHTAERDRSALYIDGLLANARGELPAATIDRLEQLQSYELSDRTRRAEAERAIESHLETLSEAEREATRERLETAVTEYARERHRSLVTTRLIRIDHTDGLQVAASGSVPGRPVDQFAFDAESETLRVATTVPQVAGVNSTNDLYTLDRATLDRRGSVQGMSPGQEIFAARYVGDTAYLVTFRQVDPFHVIDLSAPDDPVERGQVKLPGFSTYLHPVGEDRLLGVGEEAGEAKATLFDASDPTDPQVVDGVTLDAGWSAIRESHHAFLQDRRHGVSVVPAGETAHVIEDEDGLREVATISVDGRVRRAGYVGDALYVVGTNELVVVDESDWSVVDRIALPENGPTDELAPDPEALPVERVESADPGA